MTMLLDKRVPVETMLLLATKEGRGEAIFACLESAREKERWEFEGNNRGFTSRDYDW